MEMYGKMANNVWKWTKLSAIFTIIISIDLISMEIYSIRPDGFYPNSMWLSLHT